MGLLNEVTQVISRQLNVNIRKLSIETTDGILKEISNCTCMMWMM